MTLVAKIVNGFPTLTIFTKCFILDTRLGFKCTSVKFLKIISFRIVSKITVNHKNKALTSRSELRHRYLSWKLPRPWESILNDVFQNFISIEKNIFKVGNKVTSIAPANTFILISGHDFMNCSCTYLIVRLCGISFRKVQVFTINRKELCHIFPWKFERLSNYFSQFLGVFASENSPANKNMFKVDGKKRQCNCFS